MILFRTHPDQLCGYPGFPKSLRQSGRHPTAFHVQAPVNGISPRVVQVQVRNIPRRLETPKATSHIFYRTMQE